MAIPRIATSDHRLAVPAPGVFINAAEWVTRYGLVAIVLCLPLEFTTHYLHQPIVRFVLLVVGCALALLILSGRRALLVPQKASIVVLVLYCVASLVSWAVTRPPGSLNELLDVALYPGVGLLVYNLARAHTDHRWTWIAFLVSALYVAVVGFIAYVMHFQLWVPNPLGAIAGVLMYARREGPMWLAIAAAAACGIVLPMTWSRSGLVLFIFSVVLAVVMTRHRRRALTVAAVALVAFAASTAINADTRARAIGAAQTLATAVTGTSFGGESASGGVVTGLALEDNRKYLIAAGLQMFYDHPVLGTGFGAYQHELLTTYGRFLPKGFDTAVSHTWVDTLSHTSLVTIMAEQGVVGTVLMLLFMGLLGWEAWRSMRTHTPVERWTVVPAAMILPIFIYSQFEGRWFQEPYLWLMFGLLYSSFLILPKREARTLQTG